tara:strand:+ start:6835 stop:8013 length:1179 start_codon:yes stop_codon:yes gene_type:complete
MIKYILKFIIFLLFFNLSYSQNIDSLHTKRINDTILSKILNQKRSVDIQLPRSYDNDLEKKYPLMIVLDGDYMFNLVSGSVDYLSYWGDIPENIVVGINQINSRFQDTSVLDNISALPISSTALFFDFISNELIDYLEKEYRISEFKIIIGHERTANFANFFVLKKKPRIRGVISISPKLSSQMNNFLLNNLAQTKSKISYVISTSKNDFESIYLSVTKLRESILQINNSNLIFESVTLNKENHYTLPSISVPMSISALYSKYPDIGDYEYESIISKLDYSPIAYVQNKYQLIKDFYGIEKKITINDFMAIEKYIESFEQFGLFDELSKLAQLEYPETILPSYYKGRFFEEKGNPEKAMHIYRSAYNMNEVEGLSKEYLLKLADQINDNLKF